MTITSQDMIALLPLLFVGLAVVIVMLTIAIKRNHTLTAAITAAAVLVAMLTLIPAARVGALQVTPLVHMDGYAVFYMLLTLIATLATTSFAYSWLKAYPDNKEEFYLLLLIATLGSMLLASANHMASLFIGIELLSLPMFGLIGYAYRKRHPLEASFKYMLLSAAASSFLLLGIAFVYAATGELSFKAFSASLNPQLLSQPLLLTGIGLMLVGIGFKLSLVPFQLWTPDVYQGAPAPVAGFLATAGKIGVFCVVGRILLSMPGEDSYALGFTLGLLGFLSIIVGNVLAVSQRNLKRLLGYSSVAHLGYMLVILTAIGSMQLNNGLESNSIASEAIGVYLVGYLLSSIVAFGVVSVMNSPYQAEEDNDDIERYKGLYWRSPALGISLAIAMLSLAGIPLTLGFIGKFYALIAGVSAQLWWLVGAVILGSAIGLYYYLKVAVMIFYREESAKPTKAHAISAEFIIVASAIVVFILGVYPQPLIAIAKVAALLG